MVDVLDERGEKTGEVAWKSEAHRAGLRHRCFHCWILDPRGPHLFVQLRSAGKDTWPDLLDVTAAGHLRAGEETLDGLREVEEELGLSARPEELLPLGTREIEREIPGDGLDRGVRADLQPVDETRGQRSRSRSGRPGGRGPPGRASPTSSPKMTRTFCASPALPARSWPATAPGASFRLRSPETRPSAGRRGRTCC